MKKLLFLLFNIGFFSFLMAQNCSEIVQVANQQFEKKEFQQAIQSYRRVLFFEPNQGKNVYAHLGFAYWEAYQDWKNAVYYFDLAYQLSDDLKEQYDYIFNKIQVYLLVDKYDDVLLELASLEEELLTEEELQRKRFYQAIVYFQKKEYQKAENYFQKCVIDSLSKEKIHELFHKFEKKSKHFNPLKVQIMSICLPGLGQFYCGEWKAGTNSLLLVGGLTTAFIFTGQGYTVLDAVLTIFPWTQRYYSGGYQKAYQLALKKIEKEKNNTYQQVIKTIQEAK